jgi:hypothetical protein
MSNPRNTTVIAEIAPYVRLVRHVPTGIAAVIDGTTGTMHTAHPNIAASGSVRGMKDRGFWRRDARVTRAMGYSYNTSELVMSSQNDRLAALACRCGGEGCYRYQLDTGFRDATTVKMDTVIVSEAERIAQAAQTKADQALIPLEDAEDVIAVSLSIIVYLDPEGLPPVGSQERREVLAEHVIDFIKHSIDGDHVELATFIDGEELIERRDISGKVSAQPSL